MKNKEFFKKNKKKVVMISVSLVTVMVVVGGVTIYCLRRNGTVELPFFTGGGAASGMNVSGNMVSTSGITSVGMTQENFEVEDLSKGLLVEEIYVSSEDSVEEGAKVLKLSQDSVEEAREELEKALREADLACRAGAIEYEQNKITAQHDRDAAVLAGEQAQSVYDDTIASLKSGVERAQEKLEEAKEEIAEYQAVLNGNGYYEEYQVGGYKDLYEENKKLLMTRMEEWGVGWEQVVSGSGLSSQGSLGNQPSQGTSSGQTSQGTSGDQTSQGSSGGQDSPGSSGAMPASAAGGGQEDYGVVQAATADVSSGDSASYVSVLKALYSVLEQNLKDYEQAKSDYEDAQINAEFELQTLELSLSSLEKALAEAKSEYETKLLEAQLTKETSLANAQRADSDYEAALEKAASDYETLKETREDAQENLELFENSVGDGYYYASGSGTVMRTMVRKDQYLTSGGTIFLYSNPEEMTVSVSVDQSDISKLAVGDTAYIESPEYGSFRGVVTQINPVASSGSRTSVTYSVVVTVEGEAGSLPANETVSVIFGIGGAADEE